MIRVLPKQTLNEWPIWTSFCTLSRYIISCYTFVLILAKRAGIFNWGIFFVCIFKWMVVVIDRTIHKWNILMIAVRVNYFVTKICLLFDHLIYIFPNWQIGVKSRENSKRKYLQNLFNTIKNKLWNQIIIPESINFVTTKMSTIRSAVYPQIFWVLVIRLRKWNKIPISIWYATYFKSGNQSWNTE